MSSMASPPQTPGSNMAQSPYQDQLSNFCRNSGLRPPIFQVVSDRRGGRTAWSATVNVQSQQIQARFWYDGQFVNNAKEDAAQMALQRYGQLPSNGVSPTMQQQPPQNPSQSVPGSRAAYYGAVGN